LCSVTLKFNSGSPRLFRLQTRKGLVVAGKVSMCADVCKRGARQPLARRSRRSGACVSDGLERFRPSNANGFPDVHQVDRCAARAAEHRYAMRENRCLTPGSPCVERRSGSGIS